MVRLNSIEVVSDDKNATRYPRFNFRIRKHEKYTLNIMIYHVFILNYEEFSSNFNWKYFFCDPS